MIARHCLAALAAAGLLLTPAPAAAQSDARRWMLGATPFFQFGVDSFTDRVDSNSTGPTVTIESAFDTKPGFGLEGSLGVRLWRGFGIGGGLSFYAPAEDLEAGGTFTARIPHPFDSSIVREAVGPAGLKRSETAVHLNALYFIQAAPKVQIAIGAGPSIFRGTQTFINDVKHFEDTPAAPSTVGISGVTRTTSSASATGFNAVVDVMWAFGDTIGIGGLVRFSRATLPFAPAGRAVKATAGGLQAGAGLRFRF